MIYYCKTESRCHSERREESLVLNYVRENNCHEIYRVE